MRKSPLYRSLLIGWLSASALCPCAALAEALSIETPFPLLVKRLSAKEVTVDEVVDALIDGVVTLGDLPPDFQARPVADPLFNQVLGKSIRKKTLELLAAESSAKAGGLRKLAEAFLPEADENRRATVSLIGLAERVEHLQAIEKPVELVALRDETKNPEQLDLINQQLNPYLLTLAQKELAAGRPDQSLKLLAQVTQLEQRSDVDDVALRTIAAYQEQRAHREVGWELDDQRVVTLFTTLSAHHANIQTALADLYAGRTLELVAEGNAEGAAAAFDRVIKQRPDPDERNDQLRLATISAAKLPAVQAFARGRMMDLELAGRLGLMTKFKLLATGFYGKFYPIALLSCLGLVVFFALVSRLRPSFVLNVPRVRLSLPRISRKKKQLSGYKNPSFGLDEYSKLLLEFGLEDSATEEDIRKAYRQRMKELHPDGASHPQDADKFIDVKEAYERILEIQRTRFTKS